MPRVDLHDHEITPLFEQLHYCSVVYSKIGGDPDFLKSAGQTVLCFAVQQPTTEFVGHIGQYLHGRKYPVSGLP